MKNPLLDELLGHRIRTHYGTEILITYYSGPHTSYGPGSWSAGYKDDRGNVREHVNSIKTENGIITCEGKPIVILDREVPTQICLF